MTEQDKVIFADPEKDFFIHTLIKDIPLISVIPDLVDNCVDGARRLRSDKKLNGLWVRIEVNKSQFSISDNCGGMSIELAKNYAFRFGTNKNSKITKGAIGLFGIGMKRALFKLGKKFKVESKTKHESFIVEENVEKWKKKAEWQFRFKEIKEKLKNVPEDLQGTKITVRSLNAGVKASFGDKIFINRLGLEIESKHQITMENGLEITLNGISLKIKHMQYLQSNSICTAKSIKEYDNGKIIVEYFSGISDSNPNMCGWHVFCNGRLILEADKSFKTGWKDGTPAYHPQYNRFLGCVYFESDDPTLLPWNTTKDGVDEDSDIYIKVRLEMINLMKPVIRFLNDLAKEDKNSEVLGNGPLLDNIEEAKLVNFDVIILNKSFKRPPSSIPKPTGQGKILYSKPKDEINKIKKHINAKSQKEVGEKTFEYYLKYECEE